MDDQSKKWNKNLVDDDEFVDLIEADFESEGQPEDETSKKRAWSKIEAQVQGKKPAQGRKTKVLDETGESDKFWQVGLALAACVIISVAIPLLRPVLTPEQGIKGDDLPVPIELIAYELTPDKELITFNPADSSPPKTIIPMVETMQPVYVALLTITAEGVPEVVVPPQAFSPGEERGFEVTSNDLFALSWTGTERAVYCAVAFAEESDLVEELNRLVQSKVFTFDGNCLVFPEAR